MDKTKRYILLVWLLSFVCIICALGDVHLEKNYRVRLSQPVTLKCIMKEKSNVIQITWMKNGENIATYKDSANINEKYQGVINLTIDGSNVSSLTVFSANVTDEGKYSCVFNIFPGGAVTGETVLQVYEPLDVKVSTKQVAGFHTITCVARSWPLSTVYWSDADEGSPTGSAYDGFLTVTSWIHICSPDGRKKKMPKCKVLYLDKESLFSVSAGPRCRLHPVILCLLVFKIFFL